MKRENYISLARVVCAFAVVMIHTNGCFYEFNIDKCWTMSNVIECGLGFAVPIFIMVSGATLMDYSKQYSTLEFFKKRAIKTVIPFLVWSIIGNILGISGLYFVYYFFFYLFGVYLCIPLFTFIKEEYREKVIVYVVLVSFLLNYLIPFVCTILEINNIFQVSFEVASGFLMYALVGYLIHKNDVNLRWRIVIYALAVIGFALHIGGTYMFSIEAGAIDSTFRGYTNLPCLLASVGVFVLIKQLGAKLQGEKVIKAIEWLSGYTFPIYLVHFYVIELVMEVLFAEYIHTLVYKFTTPFLTITISIGIAWIIRKIPIIRKILP